MVGKLDRARLCYPGLEPEEERFGSSHSEPNSQYNSKYSSSRAADAMFPVESSFFLFPAQVAAGE